MIPTVGLEDYITGLARQHRIHYAKTSNDALAEVITRLADEGVKMDQIALLLLALERAGVIPTEDVVPLHITYLREKLKDSKTHSIPPADIPMALETAGGCARVCRARRAGQGGTKQRTLVRNEEQRSQGRRARCNRVHSAVT